MNPVDFFEEAKNEGARPAFVFSLKITMVISVVTPIVNYFGVESTDFSSAYQAQIMAYRLAKNYLLPQYGVYAYLCESILIFGFACMMLVFLAGFLHIVYKLMGGKGSILNGWKATCYGVGPCLLGGFLPYIALFAAFYSLLLQFYIGPKILYEVKEWKALLFLSMIIALTFIEMFMFGTTIVSF
jgi:hypothetical protein